MKTLTQIFLIVIVLLSTQKPVIASWYNPLSWFHRAKLQQKEIKFNIPNKFNLDKSINYTNSETTSVADVNWTVFFADPNLASLIETALKNNQEYNIFLQDIEIAKNELKEKKGEYLPKVGLALSAQKYEVSENSREGKLDQAIEKNKLKSHNRDFDLAAKMTWEVDIWNKLRNAKEAARMRLMSQYEGQNFLTTRLISEIAHDYYELMALDNSLSILDENIEIQESAFIKMQALKQFGKSNQLAVNRFEAQLLETRSQRFEIKQEIIEKENRLKFLSGIYEDKPILRNSENLMTMQIDELQVGVPIELLENRPDIRQAEYAIKAARLDLKSVKADLYPSLNIRAEYGLSAFAPILLFDPKSVVYDAVGDIVAPVINRQAIIARIQTADSFQTQMVLNYEQTLLQAYTEVLNQMSKIKNLQQSFDIKQNEVNLLDESVDIANSLFQFAKADYIEILLTQEAKLDAQTELVQTKLDLIGSKVDLYRALGGGWR